MDQACTYPELPETTLCLVQMSRIGIKVALDFNTDALTALFNAPTCYGVHNLVVTRTKCAATGWVGTCCKWGVPRHEHEIPIHQQLLRILSSPRPLPAPSTIGPQFVRLQQPYTTTLRIYFCNVYTQLHTAHMEGYNACQM